MINLGVQVDNKQKSLEWCYSKMNSIGKPQKELDTSNFNREGLKNDYQNSDEIMKFMIF